MIYFRLLMILFAITSLVACEVGPEAAPLETAKSGTPSLWKVTGTKPEQRGTAYLFGTIHILPKDVNWRTPALEDAIAQSDTLVIEVLGLEDTANAAKIFSKLAISPNQPEIEQRIIPSLRDELDEIIDKSGFPEIALNRMETWAAALSLASAQTNNLGLTSGEGVEKKLTAQFTKAKKPIEGLETIEQQLGYFDKLPESQQRKMLTNVVEDAGDTKGAFEKLFNAWISGDGEKILELADGGLLEDPGIRETILVGRNRGWTEQLDKKMQQPGTLFVGVGAAHLLGPDAVQAMLEKRGYKVEKVQ